MGIGVCAEEGLDSMELEAYCLDLKRCGPNDNTDSKECYLRCKQRTADDEESEGGVFFQ
jgi:hypothetical protein